MYYKSPMFNYFKKRLEKAPSWIEEREINQHFYGLYFSEIKKMKKKAKVKAWLHDAGLSLKLEYRISKHLSIIENEYGANFLILFKNDKYWNKIPYINRGYIKLGYL